MHEPAQIQTGKQLYKQLLGDIGSQKIFFLLKGPTVQTCLDTAENLEELGYYLTALDFRIKGVKEKLKKLKRQGKRNFGVFGVATGRDARVAVNAGARFIFSPHIDRQVIRRCRKEKIFHSTGALTPSEIHQCNELRTDSVSIYGCGLFKEAEWISFLKENYPDTRFIPAGEMGTEKITTFLELGAFAVAKMMDTGDPVFVKNTIEEISKISY